MRNWARNLGEVFFPSECHICMEHLVSGERFICNACMSKLPRTRFHASANSPIHDRLSGYLKYEDATSVFSYAPGNDVSRIVYDFKYHGYHALAEHMGHIMAKELFSIGFFSDIDAIVPVPLHWLRMMKRGYNQVERLCAGLSAELQLPIMHCLKARWHVSQTHRSARQRLANPRGKYSLKKGVVTAGHHFLLVDDVCTTGATLAAAAMALTENRDCKVTMLTLAATY